MLVLPHGSDSMLYPHCAASLGVSGMTSVPSERIANRGEALKTEPHYKNARYLLIASTSRRLPTARDLSKLSRMTFPRQLDRKPLSEHCWIRYKYSHHSVCDKYTAS